jgi:hypothetical protein
MNLKGPRKIPPMKLPDPSDVNTTETAVCTISLLGTHAVETPNYYDYKAWCSSRSVGLEVRALLFTRLIR